MDLVAERAQDVHPLVEGRRSLTEGVGTPGHVIPVDGKLVNRYRKDAPVSEGRFDLALVGRKRNARIVKEDMKFWFFPGGSTNQDIASSK